MIRYYIKIALRNIWKNNLYVFINVLGLAIALTCCVIAYLNWNFSHRFNRFYDHAERIFKVNSTSIINGSPVNFAISPLPLGPAVKTELSGVESAVRYMEVPGELRGVSSNERFNTRMAYVDKEFLDVFSFKVVKGERTALGGKGNAVVSEDLAKKLFGSADPVGQTILVDFTNGEQRNYLVGGVFERIPLNSSFRFDVMLPMDNYLDLSGLKRDDWAAMVHATFIVLKDPAQKNVVAQQLGKYVARQNWAREDWKASTFYLEPLTTMASRLSLERANVLVPSLPSSAITAPILMAVLMLLLAGFNFANTSLVMSGSRLKEISLKKVFGGSKIDIVRQFLGESIFICLSALLIVLVLAKFFVPAYSSLWAFLDLKMNYLTSWEVVPMIMLLLILTGVAGGAYPAFYVSSFEPSEIFGSKLKLFGTSTLMRLLLMLQLSISLIAIVAGVVFSQNARYQETLDLGFNVNESIIIPVKEKSQYDVFRNMLTEDPQILKTSGSEGHIGLNWYNVKVKNNDRQIFVEAINVSPEFMNTAGVKLVKGRNFSPASDLDINQSVIVTEQFVKELGLEDPVNKKIMVNDTLPLYIVGVTKDIYMHGLWEPVKPLLLRMGKEENYHFLTARVKKDNMDRALDDMEKKWRTAFPNEQWRGYRMEQMLYEAKSINRNIKVLFIYLAFVAVLLAASGLFSMISLNALKRAREFGVRKVMGASVSHIAYLLIKEFVVFFLIACVVGAVGAYLLVSWMLNSIYTYHVQVNLPAFFIAVVILLIVLAATIGHKVYKAAVANPIDAINER